MSGAICWVALVILRFLLSASVGCAGAAPPVAIPARAPEPFGPRNAGGRELPAVCRETALPLDDGGRASLVELERHLVDEVLSPAQGTHVGSGWFDGAAGEIHQLLGRFPATEMVFLFPVSLSLPKSPFRARLGLTRKEIDHADHTVFYLEVSDVRMVRDGAQTGLVLEFGAGPAGTAPKGTVWLWGEWGRFCSVRGEGGAWIGYPMGPIAISDGMSRPPDRAIVAITNGPTGYAGVAVEGQ